LTARLALGQPRLAGARGGTWSPGLIIGHNDTAPYNAAWCQGTLAGFFDWDSAGPATPEWDLAFAGFSWVPLHAYGWAATAAEFLEVVQARVKAHADGIRDLAAAGDEASGRLLRQGVADDLDQALAELASFPR